MKHSATKVSADALNLGLLGTKFSFGKV